MGSRPIFWFHSSLSPAPASPGYRRFPNRPAGWLVLLATAVLAGTAGCAAVRKAPPVDPAGSTVAPEGVAQGAAAGGAVAAGTAARDTASAQDLQHPALPDPAIIHRAPSSLARDLTLAELQQIYRQALSLLAAGDPGQAEDLLFVLQDQVAGPEPATADTLDQAWQRSFTRRTVHLAGLLAEDLAFQAGAAEDDSLLLAAYDRFRGPSYPDSLLPVGGPRRPSLAADLLTVDNVRVRRWIAYFTGPGRTYFQHWLRRKAAVDSLVGTILVDAGLPHELIYLAMIESGLSPYARSGAGAVGPWQFMPSTARLCDLRHDWWVDERRDLEMATRAAADHLSRLYGEFGDWALVLAAYNAGEGRIARAIRLAGHDDFWRLNLPVQTADYVPKFIAAARLGEDPRAADLVLEPAPPLTYDVVPVDDATDLDLIAECAGVARQDVLTLNPALLRGASPPDSPHYPVRVPRGTGERCRSELRKIPADRRLTWRRHRVERGETLGQIARRYGTTVSDIAALNSLANVHLIRPGDALLVPMPVRLTEKARGRAVERGHYVPPDGYRRVSYRVRSGDTLSGIARELGVSVTHLCKVNGINRRQTIHPGQRLYAYRPGQNDKGG
jgi:membrane-bound lytic murein transglycosylase D